MTEARLEAQFRERVRQAGGRSTKIVGDRGTPDRLVLWPGGRVDLVELKTRTGRLSTAQEVWHRRAEAYGVPVHVLAGLDEVDRYVQARSKMDEAPGGLRSP